MRSLATTEPKNDEKYLQVLKTLDPQLYLIRLALEETKVNPDIIPRIIRALGNLNIGTGWGEIVILVKERTVTQIKGSESDILNMVINESRD